MVEHSNENGLSTCGPYKIFKTLGEGGNAVVKLAEREGVKYAIKILPLDVEDIDKVVKKTKEEFEVVSQLSINGVMKYYEFVEEAIWTSKVGEQKKVCYLVMELVKGVELLEFLNECDEDMDESTLRYIFLQITKAIHELHKAGIAHRDIKLENIMLTETYEIKIIDLGYGIPLAGRSSSGFMKSRLGTYMYMAPEILNKQVMYQGQDADCFALGVCMFVAKVMDYPWKVTNIDVDEGYKMLAADHGTDAQRFWA